MACPELPVGSRGVANNLSRIGQIVQADALAAQGWSDANSFTNNPFTHLDGVVVRNIGGNDHVIVDFSAIAPGQIGDKNTVAGLARLVLDTEHSVLTALLNYQNNAWLLPALLAQTPGAGEYEDDQSARAILKEKANETDEESGKLIYRTWQLPTDSPASLSLASISQKFKCAVFKHRLQAQQSALHTLKDKVDKFIFVINDQNLRLENSLTGYDRSIAPYTQSVGMISASRTLLDLMINYPEKPNQTISADVTGLRRKVAKLEELAQRDFIDNPIPFIPRDYQESIATNANNLRRWLETDGLIEVVLVYRRFRYLVTSSQFDQLCDSISQAFALLMRSPEADYIEENWMPALMEIIDQDSRAQNLDEVRRNHSGLDVDSHPSVCDALLFGLSVVPAAAGNMPGPASFSVALMNAISPKLIGEVMGDVAKAQSYGAMYVRFMVRRGNFNQDQIDELNLLIKGPKPSTHKEIGDWVQKNFQGNMKWGLIMTLVNAAMLFYTIKSSEDETITRWINLSTLSLGASTGASLTQVLLNIQRFKDCGFLTVTGNALGVLAGAFACVASVVAAIDEYDTGDRTGVVINSLAALGAGLSVAGYLITMGVATSWAGPVGALFMVLGVVLGVLTALWSLIRSALTTYTHMQFEAFINYLASRDGIYQFHIILESTYKRRQYPELVALFEDIQTSHHGISFWYIHHSRHEVLYHDIFQNCEQVANAVHLDEDELKALYPNCCPPLED